MTIAQTDTRVMSDFNVAVKLQSAYGTAATPDKFMNMERFTPNNNPTDLEFRGMQGSLFKRKDPVKRVKVDAETLLETYISRELLPSLMECCLGSVPWASLGLAGAVSLTAAANISGLFLKGALRDTNLSGNVFYASLVVNTSANMVFYANASKTTEIGSATMTVGSGTTAITTVANIGISGTVTFGAGPSTQSSIRGDVFYMRYPYATKNNKYLTVAGYDGTDKYLIQDNAVQKLQLSSRDGEALLGETTLKGLMVSQTTSSFTGNIGDWDFYGHNAELNVYRSTSYSAEIGVTEIMLAIENNILSYAANASASVAQIKRGCMVTGTLTGQLGNELNTILRKTLNTADDGISWDQLQIKWTINGDTADFIRFNLGNVHFKGPNQREMTGEDDQPDVSFDFESYYDATRDALTVDIAV